MKCVIMAGGKGTRISSVAADIPKPMIRIGGKPVLEHEIECLREQKITDILITLSHLGEQIIEYFGDGTGVSPVAGSPFAVHIRYYFEKIPLGNAGALFLPEVREWLQDEDFLLLNADSLFHIDFRRFIAFHQKKGGLVTLFTHPNSHPQDSVLIVTDENDAVVSWLTKEDKRPEFYQNRVNAGLHILSPKVLDPTLMDLSAGKIDLDRQILRLLSGTGKVFCYDSPEYVADMGTPERYKKVCRDHEKGIILSRSLDQKQRAIF